MVTTREYDKIVQESEIVVVVRQEGAARANREHEVGRVLLPSNSGLGRNQNVVAFAGKTPDQCSSNGVIIEIEQHQERSRAHSWGVRIFG